MSLFVSASLLLVVQERNVTRIVDKMLRNAFNLGYIQLTLPKACIVHTVRHPLDVALSCFSQPFEGRGLPWASQLDGELCLCFCTASGISGMIYPVIVCW